VLKTEIRQVDLLYFTTQYRIKTLFSWVLIYRVKMLFIFRHIDKKYLQLMDSPYHTRGEVKRNNLLN